ncbi:hypothetical protein [Aerosticca soli]|uniref:Lipoprotein n=1 Tax=Aerosticca soli TaxID=2010829 RepID=A0A2Z6E6W5_9GAMM|nr:hypothetical protein [Aerosticca soli]BBD80522.1 hypothetical protein ALSL_1875 [Aerosticca soli]
MRLRHATLLALPLLASCAWMPWHHRGEDAKPTAATSAPPPAEATPAQPQTQQPRRGWLPWHWHRKPAAAPAPGAGGTAASASSASTAPVSAPVPRLVLTPPPAAAASVAVTPSVPTSSAETAAAGPYAPLSESEWRELFDAYRALALCEDRYMHSAGLDRGAVAARLVALGKADALRSEALHLLGPQAPAAWRQPPPADAQAAYVDQTLTLLMAPAPEVGLGRELARKATARYYVAEVTGAVCKPGPRYRALLRKAAQ